MKLIMSQELMSNKELTASEKMLVAFLSFRQGKNPYCFWSQEEMANALGTTRISVKRDCKRLEKKGYIAMRLIRRGRSFVNAILVNKRYSQYQIDRVNDTTEEGFTRSI